MRKILLFLFVVVAFGYSDDYSQWKYKCKININTVGLTATNILNYPLAVRLTTANFPHFSKVKAGGCRYSIFQV